MPKLEGLSTADAERRLEGIDLRWRYGPSGPVESRAGQLDDLVVLEQQPEPGDSLSAGGIVQLETRCTLTSLAMGLSCVDG